MKLAARISSALFVAFLLSPPAAAQAPQELIEEIKRLAGQVADLRDAHATQTRRIVQMQKEIDGLRDALRDSHERATSKMGDFATREDLKKIIDSIRDVDEKRQSDRELILKEFEKLGQTLSQPSRGSRGNSRRSSRDEEPPAAPIEGTFLPYTVKPGQLLSHILEEYNGALKKQGLPSITMDQIVRANPGSNPNKIYVGQTLQLPAPEKR